MLIPKLYVNKFAVKLMLHYIQQNIVGILCSHLWVPTLNNTFQASEHPQDCPFCNKVESFEAYLKMLLFYKIYDET